MYYLTVQYFNNLYFLRFSLVISDPTLTLILTIEGVLSLEVRWIVAKHTSLASTSSLVRVTLWCSWSSYAWTMTHSTGRQLWMSCNSWRQWKLKTHTST